MLHRILIQRLIIATMFSIGLIGVVVYVMEVRRFDRLMTFVGHLHLRIIKSLMSADRLYTPYLDDKTALKDALRVILLRRDEGAPGHFVFIRILDVNFSEMARKWDKDYAFIEDVKRYADASLHITAPKTGPEWHGMIKIGNIPYIHFLLRTDNDSGGTIAYEEGIYEISPEAYGKIYEYLLEAVIATICIILLTTALLYPWIFRLFHKLAAASIKLLDANLETLQVLGSSISKRDSDTDIHNYRVTIYAVRLAEAVGVMGPENMRSLIKGAFLHDVGKIGVTDNILWKPGKLSEEEFTEMKRHVNYGVDIVKRASWLQDTIDVVGSHHEKYDGSGYTQSRFANDIPRNAKIFAIVDVFDALTSERPYKKPLNLDDTMHLLEKGHGSHFDPQLLDVFLGIAPDLYTEIADASREVLQEKLELIIEQYFRSQTSPLLE